MKKRIIIIVIIIVAIIIGYFSVKYYQNNNTTYQMNKLINGSPKEKIMAAQYMGKNKVAEAIPLLVVGIDSNDSFLYKGIARWTLTCIATVSLGEITGKDFGHLCNDAKTKTEEQLKQIIKAWQDWYDNEYSK